MIEPTTFATADAQTPRNLLAPVPDFAARPVSLFQKTTSGAEKPSLEDTEKTVQPNEEPKSVTCKAPVVARLDEL